MIASIVLYILFSFCLRGNLLVALLGKWFCVQFVLRPGAKDENMYSNGLSFRKPSKAMKMLYYPMAHTIAVLPPIIYRWDEPFGSTGFCAIVFALSGFINVVLFILTRPPLLLGNDDASGTMVHTRIAPSAPVRAQSRTARSSSFPLAAVPTPPAPILSFPLAHTQTEHIRGLDEQGFLPRLRVGAPQARHRSQ
ncbi:hypothetical protein BOTBODRAFT_189885 [Botryobasidium botryosum FD-172 SS1]|uniref:Uncharacterized protein n=1 Tax=Botryobasidium botryosum (strain FD-172 SS1) TaxID=930990 RepID=A0A067M737_BOTB1|nr:hypothetical protein BOTBODRAFT_189885 [Botryobasidium botryosum FD-172 SS1]